MRYKISLIILLTAVLLLLSGCNVYAVGDLYSLPKRSDNHTNLQNLVAEAMNGREYAAPSSGDHQQTVQTIDLDGDNLEEYLLFAKDGSDKPLKIFVFAYRGGKYCLLDTIESTGTNFDQVEYVYVDDRPGFEIVVGRQVSDQVVGSVSVYSLQNDQLEQLMTTNYTQFLCCDLNTDGSSEVFVLRPGDNGKGVAALYDMMGGAMERSHEAEMSEPAENVKRIMFGRLDDDVKAVYVASSVTNGDGIITDVYALLDGLLTNVSFSNDSGTSVQTLRNHYIYAVDIDGDGALELPSLINVRSAAPDSENGSIYIIRWYAMRSDGSEVDKKYTYHNFVGGWYVELNAAYADHYTVEQKGSSYEFGLWNENFTEIQKLWTVFALTGQKREEQAVADNRFVLHRSETAIYAASLEVESATYGLTQDSLISGFHLILQDWKTGET